jgi:uncharacterized membrane protein
VPDTIGGLPVHPLVVHAVVVLVPLAVLLLLAAIVSATVRRRAGIVTPILATVALLLVPVATESGEGLERRLARSALVRAHAELGDSLLPWMAGVALTAWVLWWLTRRQRGEQASPTQPGRGGWFLPAAVLAAIACTGTAVQVVRIGDSGARAVWQQSVPLQPASQGEHGDD